MNKPLTTYFHPNKQNYVLGFIILFIVVVVGLLNWYSTPTMMEDLLYRFVWLQDWDSPLNCINSLSDVVRSQYVHYWCNGGRVLVHAVAQILLNLVPDQLSKLLNTGMFLLMIVLLLKVVNAPKALHPVIIVLAFAMIFIVLQGFNMGFIWLIGSNNYLWPMVINMAFLLLFRYTERRSGIVYALLPLLILFGLVAGWTHEALSVPVTTALLYWAFRHRRGLLSHPGTYGALAYIVGTVMILLSPALWSRVNVEGVTIGQRLLGGALNLVLNVRISWLLLVTLAILLKKGKKIFLGNIEANQYLMIAWLTAMGIVLACGETLERVAIYADSLAMVILLSIWQGEWIKRHQYQIVFIVMMVCAIVAVPAISLNRENHENYLYHSSQIEKQGTDIIKIRQMADGDNIINRWLRKRYVFPNIEFGFPNCYMPFDSNDLENRCVAHLYGKEHITMLPEDVVVKIETDSSAYANWEADSNGKLYVWRLQPATQVSSVVFELGDEVSLPFYKRWTSYPGNEYEIDSFKYEVITLKGNDYLITTIPIEKIRRRIREIRLSR